MKEQEAWKALNKLIDKSRVHFYKPIQIAEILNRSRKYEDVSLENIEDYRNRSKVWRDQISQRLVGRISTSSQKYQDNLFDSNAIPPEVLIELDKINKSGKGQVEKYIYHQLSDRLKDITKALNYLHDTQSFNLGDFMGIFKERAGLRRSIDKAYEIAVYAIFSAILNLLRVDVVLSINESDQEILEDFKDFREKILGLTGTNARIRAKVYRAGSTNAADKGLDIWANFGPAVQIKHIDLSEDLAEDAADSVSSDAKVILVCKGAEKDVITKILSRIVPNNIVAIVTMEELERWYNLCLSKYKDVISSSLLETLIKEFETEFPSSGEMDAFMKERGYL